MELGRMFKNRDHAIRALKKLTDERTTLDGDEIISPAEEWAIKAILMGKGVTRSHRTYPQRRRLIGIARSLGVYPVPEWWFVKQRLLGHNWDEKVLANLWTPHLKPYSLGQVGVSSSSVKKYNKSSSRLTLAKLRRTAKKLKQQGGFYD